MRDYAFASLEEIGEIDDGRCPVRAVPHHDYNLARVESLVARKDNAIAHLARAIELSEQFRGHAGGNSDRDAIRDEPGFKSPIAS